MKYLLTIMGLILFHVAFTQTPKEIARQKGTEAVQLMDAGNIQESLELLKQAQKLDPDNYVYPYEVAYANYVLKNYSESIKILKGIINYKGVNDRLYQLLGNSYDMMGNSKKAIKIYDRGLKIFVNSGKLYLEKGNVFWMKKEYLTALPFYEKGIEVDPSFPSNYYRAALIYCSSSEKVWGMIYGEIFINLERNSRRTQTISKLLYDNYVSQISIVNDTTISVSFSKDNIVEVNDKNKLFKLKLPYGTFIYETLISMSVAGTTKIDINTLSKIRANFIRLYYQKGYEKKYPNVLFAYEKKILDLGYFDEYSHWILMKGDEKGFEQWLNENKSKWNSFIEWFSKNPININKENAFFSGQYR
ncbi:MAG: hypothetical protein JXR65_03115 [Bacteroidales bacterium]|nr:hypothetical protein [Bacteroidales bacterium]